MEQNIIGTTIAALRREKGLTQDALAAQLGILDVIKNETVTCYNGVPGAGCGPCPSCLLRNRGLKAFERRRAE